MDAAINYLIQDSGNAIKAIDINRALLDSNGFTAETYTGITDARITLRQKETAQNNAVTFYKERTNAQNAEVSKAQDLIRRVRDAARGAYGKDKTKLEPFKVNDRMPESVKKLCSHCDYLSGIAEEHKTDLLSNGLIEEDLENLKTASINIDTADTTQENARKLQKSATIERDQAAKVLEDKIYKFRKFIKARFSKRPEISVQFEPIPKGRGGGSTEEEKPPENPTEPQKQ